MARIRTIKPEFPQSESMGAVSRDARLLFIMLFTLADDEGRLRGNSRMLASLLFPYDLDAPKLIDKWVDELITQRCIIRYQIEDATYVEICKWLNHQKIDRPSKSKIPAPPEDSREFAKIREDSSEDQGRDQGKDQGSGIKEEKTQRASRLPQDWQPNDRMLAFCENERPDLNPMEVAETFRDYWHSQAGQKGVKADWEATWRNWVRNQRMAAKSPQRAAIGYRSQNELIAAELIAELKNA
jgi:hypothetical protein